MRLVLPLPETWPRRSIVEGVEVMVSREVAIVIGPVTPLPVRSHEWADGQIVGTTPLARVVVRRAVDRTLAAGWPVVLVDSDVLGADGEVVERRLHALYQFLGHGCAVVARAAAPALDAARAALEELMLGAALDCADGTVTALADVWAGLEVVTPTTWAEPAKPDEPKPSDRDKA